MRTKNKWMTAVGVSALLAGAVQLRPQEVTAADHADSPGASTDAAADITDFYAWHTGRGTIVAIIGYSGLMMPGAEPMFDDEVLYTICVDNAADEDEASDYNDNDNANECVVPIYIRFGQNSNDEWGVQVQNLPGEGGTDTIEGPVEQQLDGENGTRAWAGLRDDPFFFDFQGFTATIANLQDPTEAEDIAFTGATPGMQAVDALAGTNVMAIVVEFDAAAAANGNTFLQMWATTGRL